MTVAPQKEAITPSSDAGSLLQIFRDGIPRTRLSVQQLTGLGRTAVSARIDALIAAGLLAPSGGSQSQGGRPAALVSLDGLSRAVIGVDIGASHALVAVCSIAPAVRATRRTQWEAVGSPEEVLGWVVDAVLSCLSELGLTRDDVLGLGIGLPARVDFQTGRPVNPILMPGWDGYDLRGYLRERLTPHVLVDNDVNILAVNERSIAWPGTDDLVYIKIGTGLGGGIIMGGQVQRGASGTAGDLGHIPIPRSRDERSESRNLGQLVSGFAIVEDLRSAGLPVNSIAQLIELARRPDPRVVTHLHELGQVLGEALASIVDVLNPSVIILGGRLGNEGEHLLAGVRDSVYRLALPAATKTLQIVQSQGGEWSGALGAARLALDTALSPDAINARVTARG